MAKRLFDVGTMNQISLDTEGSAGRLGSLLAYTLNRASRRAFPMTDTELKAMCGAAYDVREGGLILPRDHVRS